MGKRQDLTGMKYGMLTAVSEAEKNNQGSYKWNFSCDCGGTVCATAAAVKFGNTSSCGCIRKNLLVERNKTHGMSKNPAYSNWKDMFKRCYNPNNKRYEHYHGKGIGVDEQFNYFPNFLDEIGEKPSDGQRWSVGRIDNNLSYQPGNVRWELDVQQARNHSLQSNNTTGIAGVTFKSGKYAFFKAGYNNLEGVRVSKNFSVNKYGYENAKELAIKFREDGIKLLQEQGAGYADSHGK